MSDHGCGVSVHVFNTVLTAHAARPKPIDTAPGDLVLIFAPNTFPDDLIEQQMASFPGATVVGCSTAGQFVGAGLAHQCAVISRIRFEKPRVKAEHVAVSGPEGSYFAGASLGRKLASPDLRAVMVLADALVVNASQLLEGLYDRLDGHVPVIGGLAADHDRFQHTWVMAGGRVGGARVAAVGFYGEDLVVGHGAAAGWDIFGPERLVTRAQGNVLYELDGRSALDLYRRYLGHHANSLPTSGLRFPLAIRSDKSEQWVTRTVLAIDEASGAVVFRGEVPEGHRARLMMCNKDRLIGAASTAAELAELAMGPHRASLLGDPLALVVSGFGRRLVLGDRTDDELELVHASLQRCVGPVGFYGYGQFCALPGAGFDLHNQTMSVTLIGERT